MFESKGFLDRLNGGVERKRGVKDHCKASGLSHHSDGLSSIELNWTRFLVCDRQNATDN